MRRRKPFKQVDGNRRDRHAPPNDAQDDDSKNSAYSPTASIVAKTRHLVNDDAFNFLSSSLELKFARKHEERQKKARVEIANSRERSIKEKATQVEKKTNTNTSQFGSQTKTPKISNCTGNDNNNKTTPNTNKVVGVKRNNDEEPQRVPVEGSNQKSKSLLPLKKPKLATIEEEDPMQLSDTIGADERAALRTGQLENSKIAKEEQIACGPDLDGKEKAQHRDDSNSEHVDAYNRTNDDNLYIQETTLKTPVAKALTSSREKVDTGISDLSSRLGKHLEIRDESLDDMELVATDDKSLRSSSASSREESYDNVSHGVEQAPTPPPSVLSIPKASSQNEPNDFRNDTKRFESPELPVAASPAQSLYKSGHSSQDMVKTALSKRFQNSPIMPNSTSLSKTPVAFKTKDRQRLLRRDSVERKIENGEMQRVSETNVIIGDGLRLEEGGSKQEEETQGRKVIEGSPEGTVDKILRELIATPPDNAEAVRAMLTSCKEDWSLPDDLLGQGFVIEFDRTRKEGLCDEASEVTCDIDLIRKRKKNEDMPKARKRTKTSASIVHDRKDEQCDPSDCSAWQKSLDSIQKTHETGLPKATSEKKETAAEYSNAKQLLDQTIPSAATPAVVKSNRTLPVTPPTDPYFGFPSPLSSEATTKKLSTETKAQINSPYLWTAQRAGHLIVEPIFQLDGNFYRHPPLPPGWTISVSQTRSQPFYHHPDFGSTWYPPVPLPMTDGNFVGRRMLVSTHSAEKMIPWSAFVSQLMQNNTQVATSQGKQFSVSDANPCEELSSCVLKSAFHRETPKLPTISRNVAFSDQSAYKAEANSVSRVQNGQMSVPSSGDQAQKSSPSESSESVLSRQNHEGLVLDPHGSDCIDHVEVVSKYASDHPAGKKELLRSQHQSPEISESSVPTSQSATSTASGASANSSERHVQGILDTPAHSKAESHGPRKSFENNPTSLQWKHHLYVDDFRGVGYESEISIQETCEPDKASKDVGSGDMNLGRKHVCLSEEGSPDRARNDCSDTESRDPQKSDSREICLAQSNDLESPNSPQLHDNDFPAADDDDDDHILDRESPAKYLKDPDSGSGAVADLHETQNWLNSSADDDGENWDSPGLPPTNEPESPYDGLVGQLKNALKANSIFVPRVKRSELDESNTHIRRGADDTSVDSWRSRASSLMSSSSHRVRFPPMPLCSLQSLEACPIIEIKVARNDRSRKTKPSNKVKKIFSKKPKRMRASKAF
ncbi:hypothetical protein FisN_21Hh197 [Fistulifera solaris]|uniref:WW domain-containing protein n=1 Tax=Fistulifera solaris TaxID=1519565 RepID=A0A1Z5JRU3_FISSO|nr:hypothetical protein FisN_21Hh197 [Fistulifera solaris]|eukprot:GAX16750.1 hypothetical protein FisN_21Hh197 [Fistulifera solaris]